ncbi:MAG: FAD-binding oxidoreductase [Jatrophihabitans sp.]|uniref:FAD-binding oxidoreductase n=1 Tax=Jatrophihabitans sp. TaxID=1932789 RepID=UPI003F816EC4
MADATKHALDDLIDALPPDTVITDPDVIASYRQCWSHDPNAGTPQAVVRANSTADVQATLRWASATGTKIVPRGAGTSLSGGSTGVEGAVTLSLERMRDIVIDSVTRVAHAQPGALNAEVKQAAAAHGLWYPPDPSSFEICSIGGNAATNAGGLCCVKYGVTTDYVLGMEVVLADGTALTLGGPRVKDVAGLSLTKLFVGSEGTLGIITALTLRLLPAPPVGATLVANFPSVDAAAQAVVAITASVRPALLELMDNGSINAVEDMLAMGLDRTAGALLVARSDAPGLAADAEIEAMATACTSAGAAEVFTTTDPDEGEAFLVARRAAFPAMERLGSLLLEDVGVPLPQLPALVRGVEAIAAERDTHIVLVAHAGDGNTHPIIAYPPGDAEAAARAELAFAEIMELAISLGGTITGEHGVGRLKAPWLPAQLGPDVMALTRRIKDALDPQGLLNPGVVLPAVLPG